jgi:hypothetical protein
MNQTQPAGKPIIVTIEKPQSQQNSELKGLSDVLLGSLGLTGLLVLGALVLGIVVAAVMFWMRSSKPFDH